ncbi:MAG: hypothetical protein JNM17_26210 [Archangium sp.]|nr:hypothetical protein [Archangium sp.]
MKHRLIRLIAIATVAALFFEGCLLSRLVDRAFLGITVRRPAFVDRKTTGVFLLPFTFVLDAATFPIQALLVVILGDQFPFNDPPDAINNMQSMLDENQRYQQLGESEKKIAKLELEQLILDKKLTPNTALGLGDDGHWTVVELSADTRQQLIARAGGFSPATPSGQDSFSPDSFEVIAPAAEELACR